MASRKDYERVRSSNESARGQDDIEMERMSRSERTNGAKKQNRASRGLMYDVDEADRRQSSDTARASEDMKDREMLNEMQKTNSRRPVSDAGLRLFHLPLLRTVPVFALAIYQILPYIICAPHPLYPP